MKEQSYRYKHFITLVVVVTGALLVWLVFTKTYAAYLADSTPELVLGIQSPTPSALLMHASKSFNPDQAEKAMLPARNKADFSKFPEADKSFRIDARTRNKIRSWAELTLINDPLNPRALRILGQLADSVADQAGAGKFMRAATRLSNRESLAIYWLMLKSYENYDYAKTADYADVLLRSHPQTIAQVMPLLARMAERKASSSEVKRLIASTPPWRSSFFARLPANVTDASTPLHLLLSIKDTPSPPSAYELRAYLNFLIKRKLYELAYYSWLQFLSPAQLGSVGLLFNGHFETDPSGVPFDWVIRAGAGTIIDMVTRPDQDDQRALLLKFEDGRVSFHGITQMIMLKPGSYRLEGEYMGKIVGRRGLLWRITCAGSNRKPIAASSMVLGVSRSWRKFELTFTVPKENCQAQYVRLVHDARSASEQMVRGQIWYDELRVSRVNETISTNSP